MSDSFLVEAARLSNPWGESRVPVVDAGAHDDIAGTLIANKISFINLERRYGDAMASTFLHEHFVAEKTEFDIQRAEFERIRLDFEAHGIQTLLFKSTGLYPSFPHLSSNLDVLVDPGRGESARRRLHRLDYTELVNVEEPAKYLFRKFAGGGACFTFHLHELVGWGVPFLDVDNVWENSRPADDDPHIRIPALREALLITLAHWFYEDKTLTLENLYLTADALCKLDEDLGDVFTKAEQRGWGDGFNTALGVFSEACRRLFDGALPEMPQVDDYVSGTSNVHAPTLAKTRYGGMFPASLSFMTNKIVYFRKLFRDTRRSTVQKWSDFWKTLQWALRWKLHILSQKPLLVTISGCDGSGKTVQTERLAEVFRRCDIRVKTIWARGASSRGMAVLSGVAKKLLATGRSKPTAESKDDATEATRMVERQRKMRNPLTRLVFSVLYAIDLAWVYCIKTRFYLLIGYVVICDRYLDDARVDYAQFSGTPVETPPAALRALVAICPQAHVAFLLDVDENEALRRKPEEGSTDHLAEARAMFSTLATETNMTVIGPDVDVDAAYETINQASLGCFYKRYGTLINWLLASNPGQLNPGRWRGVDG